MGVKVGFGFGCCGRARLTHRHSPFLNRIANDFVPDDAVRAALNVGNVVFNAPTVDGFQLIAGGTHRRLTCGAQLVRLEGFRFGHAV